MSTEPTTPPAASKPQPDWAMLVLFTLLAGAGLYSLEHAFSTQAKLNRQLVAQNAELKKQLTHIEAAQNNPQGAKLIAALERGVAKQSDTIAQLEARLAAAEKTVSAPAPVIEFTAPPAGDKETLQQFVALKKAVEKGAPFAVELRRANALPEVAAIHERIAPFAAQGVAGESALREQLEAWLADHPATITVEDPKLAPINKHLSGLLTIRRKQLTEDAYATLRAQAASGASLALLRTSIEELPEEARAALAPIPEQLSARLSALAALAAAEQALLTDEPAR